MTEKLLTGTLSLNTTNQPTNANRTLGFLKRNIKTKNTAIRTAAYQTLVRPQVEYASTVWSPFTQTYINKIEMVQRRAVRWVNSNYSTYARVSSMLDSLIWRSLEDRRADARLILFYKIVYNLVAVPLPQYINHPVRMTRHMHPLHFVQIPATASYYKYSFFPFAIVQWNRLPHHIPVLSDLDSFSWRDASAHLSECPLYGVETVYIDG